MDRCDWCGQESDILVPMTVDMGDGWEAHDEEWCPACAADQVTEEAAFYTDREEA